MRSTPQADVGTTPEIAGEIAENRLGTTQWSIVTKALEWGIIFCWRKTVSEADHPKLKLQLAGEAFVGGRVPVTVVAGKLQALQSLLFHAAAAISNDRSARRGQWFNKYRDAAELAFSDAHHSDLVIEAELAVDPVLSEAFDTGKQAVDLVFDAGHEITEGRLPVAGLSKDDQVYLLRAFEGLMPGTTDQYQVSLENCNATSHPRLVFTPETRRAVRRLVAAPSGLSVGEATVVGELIKIHLGGGEDKITVRSASQEIDCFYPESFRDTIANLLAGSLVEVTGRATLDDRGQVRKLTDLVDVDTVSLDPLRISRFEHAGRRYQLASSITVNVDYRDGLWVYFSEALNLWGYAERREDALRDLHESFDYVYREIAEADDDELDTVAQKLKATLCALRPNLAQGDNVGA